MVGTGRKTILLRRAAGGEKGGEDGAGRTPPRALNTSVEAFELSANVFCTWSAGSRSICACSPSFVWRAQVFVNLHTKNPQLKNFRGHEHLHGGIVSLFCHLVYERKRCKAANESSMQPQLLARRRGLGPPTCRCAVGGRLKPRGVRGGGGALRRPWSLICRRSFLEPVTGLWGVLFGLVPVRSLVQQ